MAKYQEELTPALLEFAIETRDAYKQLMKLLNSKYKGGIRPLGHLTDKELKKLATAMQNYRWRMIDIYSNTRLRLFPEAQYHDVLTFVLYFLPLLEQEIENRHKA